MVTSNTPGLFQYTGSQTDTLIPLSIGGVKDIDGTLKMLDDAAIGKPVGIEPSPPPPLGTMRLGLGGGVGTLALVNANSAALHSVGAYQYWNSWNIADWSIICGHFDDTWPWFIAAPVAGTLLQYRTMLATFPAGARSTNVYISMGQEKDNDPPYRTGNSPNFVYNGALYISDSAPLRQAVDEAIAAGKTYLRKSVSLMPMTVYDTPTAESFIASDVKHLMMSFYAQAKDKGSGHVVATRDAVQMPKRIGDFTVNHGMTWDAAAWGFFLPDAYLNDPISIQNRVDWMVTSAREAKNNGVHFAGWFDTPWTVGGASGDYRVQTDSQLLAAWNGLLGEFGQYP